MTYVVDLFVTILAIMPSTLLFLFKRKEVSRRNITVAEYPEAK